MSEEAPWPWDDDDTAYVVWDSSGKVGTVYFAENDDGVFQTIHVMRDSPSVIDGSVGALPDNTPVELQNPVITPVPEDDPPQAVDEETIDPPRSTRRRVTKTTKR